MKSTAQTRPTKDSQKQEGVRATQAQVLRQAGWILVALVVWSLLLVGYLALFGPGGAPAAGSPAPTEAVPPTAAPTALATGTATPAAPAAVSFSAGVLPILSGRCVRCHGTAQSYAGVDLSSYDSVLAGSRGGPIVVPGSSATSELVQVIRSGRMPQGGPKLSDADIETIATWIDEGAPDN